MSSQRVYTFVRKDIPIEDQMVQVGHSCLLAGGSYGSNHKTILILCEVSNKNELFKIASFLAKEHVDYEMFYEPSNARGQKLGYTSLTTEPIKNKLESSRIKLWTNRSIGCRIRRSIHWLKRKIKLKILPMLINMRIRKDQKTNLNLRKKD